MAVNRVWVRVKPEDKQWISLHLCYKMNECKTLPPGRNESLQSLALRRWDCKGGHWVVQGSINPRTQWLGGGGSLNPLTPEAPKWHDLAIIDEMLVSLIEGFHCRAIIFGAWIQKGHRSWICCLVPKFSTQSAHKTTEHLHAVTLFPSLATLSSDHFHLVWEIG